MQPYASPSWGAPASIVIDRGEQPAAREACPSPLEPRLLAGPHALSGAESLAAHVARVGTRPIGGRWLLDEIERAGLTGRGGAGFPTARKWAEVARHARGDVVVVANVSEGEPLSAKDRTLLALRPHLVIDGALLAAETLGANRVVVYVAQPFGAALDALARALREQKPSTAVRVDVVRTEHRYIAGESSAVAQRIEGGPAKPRFTPPHTSRRGVDGRPTLVQNAETLAHVALIARRGAAWFRERGSPAAPGTALLTLSGAVGGAGVFEVSRDATIGDVLAATGGVSSEPVGALIGGYFGEWVDPQRMAGVPLSARTIGCGVIHVLAHGTCGIAAAAEVIAYLAGESAGQCGPCVHGLRAVADTVSALAAGRAAPSDVALLRRRAESIRGRGACGHPDGAVANVLSALDAFAPDVARHAGGHPCPGALRTLSTAPPSASPPGRRPLSPWT